MTNSDHKEPFVTYADCLVVTVTDLSEPTTDHEIRHTPHYFGFYSSNGTHVFNDHHKVVSGVPMNDHFFVHHSNFFGFLNRNVSKIFYLKTVTNEIY